MAKSKKHRRKHHRGGMSDGGGNIVTGTLDTLKSFAKMDFWKEVGLGFAGAASYVLVPTAIESIFKTNTTGWKMPLTGILGATVVSAVTRKKSILMGALAAFSAHWMYAKGNGAFIKPIFGQYAARFDAQAVETFADAQPALQPGATIRRVALPDGSEASVAVYPKLNDAFAPNLSNDYVANLNDTFVSALEDNYSSQLNDEGDEGNFDEFM